MPLTVTPFKNDRTQFEITGQRAGKEFRMVVSEILPDSGQAMTPRGYRDVDPDVISAARAAGVPEQLSAKPL